MTLFGWDASDFDWARGPMDLAAARADGIDFFTHKATESTNVKHVHYREALERARAAGIPFLGAYIVIRSGSVSPQVDYFLSYLDAQTPWWRAMPEFFIQVDLEHWSANGAVYDAVAQSQGVECARLLRQRTGKWVVLYAPQWAYGNGIGGADPLWASAYGGNPAGHYRELYPGDGDGKRWQAYSGRTPVFLQYGSRTTIGSQPGCDANAFRGSLADLRQLITGHAGNEEDDVQQYMIVRDNHTGQLYLCDGMTSRPIADEDVAHIKTLAAEGLFGLANGGATRDSWYPGAFGPVPGTGGGATGSGPVDLSDKSLADVRTVVDQELDEQSRAGADND